jgi:ATP-binding cassette, subfamily B, bacterial
MVFLDLLRAGTVLVRPWPLAFAVDYALSKPATAPEWSPFAESSPLSLLIVAGASGVLLSGLLGVLDIATALLTQGTAERIRANLRAELFDRMLTRPLPWHDRTRTEDLVSRLTTDVARLLDVWSVAATSLLPNTVLIIAMLTLIATMDEQLALVGASMMVALGFLAVRERRLVWAARQRARHESRRLLSTSRDWLRNVRAVHAFDRRDRAVSAFRARNQSTLEADLRTVHVTARWSPLSASVLAVGSAIALTLGGMHVLDGGVSLGALLVVLAYFRDLSLSVQEVTRLPVLLTTASTAMERLAEVRQCAATVPHHGGDRRAPLLQQHLRCENLHFRYRPGSTVLTDFNLSIQAGETVCLLGPSGTGKSTILHLMLRLYDVDEGRILVDGVDIRDCSLSRWREQVAFMPQDPWLQDGTLAENIAFGSRTATRAAVLLAGRSALVDEFADRLPHGYDTVLGEGGVNLVEGQRRRVSLARAMVSTAPLVLLDEPTAFLDPASAALLISAIESSTRDRTVVMATQDDGLARIADRTVRVDHSAWSKTDDTQPLAALIRERWNDDRRHRFTVRADVPQRGDDVSR